MQSAREVWTRIYPLLDTALTTSYVAAVKAALEAVGFSAGPTREPVLPLEPADAARIAELASAFRPQPVA
jgi:4-hydroxy-tetrahydrodipicolinate synthase